MDFWGWLTSANVLETVFDGVLGAAIGAGVAVFVLKKTLAEQSHGLERQLENQAKLHAQQLEKQDNHHIEQTMKQDESLLMQLEAQRQENIKNRINNTSADLLGAIALIPRSRGLGCAPSFALDTMSQTFISAHRMRLDLSDEDDKSFGQTLDKWLQHLHFGEFSLFLTPDDTHDEQGSTTLNRQCGWLLKSIPGWIKATEEDKLLIAQEMIDSLNMAKTKGPEVWMSMVDSED